jgi:hypothetical protein
MAAWKVNYYVVLMIERAQMFNPHIMYIYKFETVEAIDTQFCAMANYSLYSIYILGT